MEKHKKVSEAISSNQASSHFLSKHLAEGGFILVLAVALFIFLSLVTYQSVDPGWTPLSKTPVHAANAGGKVGVYLAWISYWVFGYVAYLIPLFMTYVAAVVLIERRHLAMLDETTVIFRGVGLLLTLIGLCGLLSLQIQANHAVGITFSGGIVGRSVVVFLGQSFNVQGALLFVMALLLVGMTWLTGLSWLRVVEVVGRCTLLGCRYGVLGGKVVIRWVREQIATIEARSKETVVKASPVLPAISRSEIVSKKDKPTPRLLPNMPALLNKKVPTEPPVVKKAPSPVITKKVAVGSMPSLDLLEKGQPGQPLGGYESQALETLSRDVEQHLLDFGIHVDVVAVHPGPVITRFELQLAAGVKVSRLTALAKDLARSLSVTSVRVVEIIPGKTVVGIELPNPNRAMVRLSDVFSSEVYQQALSPLTLALGVDIAGHPMVVDLAKMPHLLVAGTTGSGKSVGINAMILSLLFQATPEQVRLILVDPKMLELSIYDNIPHLLTPVVTDMRDAASALRWCVAEMERRYRLMAALGVRNLQSFNTLINDAQARNETISDPIWKPTDSMDTDAPALTALPYIVVVIDELADMMMVVGKKVEQLIARIAQKARAAGIHLILATQRPSVDVLTGLIKSNIPTRISFQVSSKIDSRTILDQQGAEQLLGHGDMLFLAPGTGAPLRVHGAFVDDQEVHRVTDDWRLRGTPDYIEAILQIAGENGESDGFDDRESTEDADPLYDQAVEFIIQTRKASVSSVQRRFKIGYNRAARLVEEMERTGLVGPLEGGFRDVLVGAMAGDES